MEFKSGTRDWVNVSVICRPRIDQVKRSAATEELSTIAKALSRLSPRPRLILSSLTKNQC